MHENRMSRGCADRATGRHGAAWCHHVRLLQPQRDRRIRRRAGQRCDRVDIICAADHANIYRAANNRPCCRRRQRHQHRRSNGRLCERRAVRRRSSFSADSADDRVIGRHRLRRRRHAADHRPLDETIDLIRRARGCRDDIDVLRCAGKRPSQRAQRVSRRRPIPDHVTMHPCRRWTESPEVRRRRNKALNCCTPCRGVNRAAIYRRRM